MALNVLMLDPSELDMEQIDAEVAKIIPRLLPDFQLKREEVKAAARTRLQDAQLYNPTHPHSVSSYLQLTLDLKKDTFTIKPSYMKWVVDPASSGSSFVITWELDWLDDNGLFMVPRSHSGDPGYILYWVSEHTDKFIDEYLRVNADACAHR